MSGCQAVNLGDGASAIICGGKKDHTCDDKGKGILMLDDGSEVEYTDENENKYRERIRGGSVTCSICERPAIADAPYL